jgi:CheY-like chemotaxis protein
MISQTQNRADNFEQGDLTALVCVDEPDLQQLVFEQLDKLGYKIQTGLFMDDIALKLRTSPYNLVVIYEHFGGSDFESNQVLQELIRLPISQRREVAAVLIGANMATSDEAQAFRLNVDQVVSIDDAQSLSVIVRRAVSRHLTNYHHFKETLRHMVIA